MHGLVNRAIQRFVVDSYGAPQWAAVARRADLGFVDFEAMWTYDDAVTPRVLTAVSDILDRPYDELMEDIGNYLVSHPNLEALRRLLRFGGVNFIDFLHSLDDLPDRARLAVSDLVLPRLELREHGPHQYSLACEGEIPGCGHLFTGVLRAMADDYGALVFLEHMGAQDGVETVSIALLETDFTEGRGFELGAQAS
ncbi:heme NO-binding domain-containing protein [Roseobacter sinensis]|uniref:Heme NO-binding domain-containing protein n=1 Tax=Roseobacter sinensis TaxID=2931391 RepID=A0ABT3BDH1_9RHOB|nr:heme NO-binding domain-containing protein [Roseobacter sp. WL0113]MCV3271208.1 heme NO-binding domain-containing protein [Roseobacter sp. WL0113]